jgi:hypothetical protein
MGRHERTDFRELAKTVDAGVLAYDDRQASAPGELDRLRGRRHQAVVELGETGPRSQRSSAWALSGSMPCLAR